METRKWTEHSRHARIGFGGLELASRQLEASDMFVFERRLALASDIFER